MSDAVNPSLLDDILEKIARKHLGIQTLVPQGSDRLDFHEQSVCRLRGALEAAFQAGVEAANRLR